MSAKIFFLILGIVLFTAFQISDAQDLSAAVGGIAEDLSSTVSEGSNSLVAVISEAD